MMRVYVCKIGQEVFLSDKLKFADKNLLLRNGVFFAPKSLFENMKKKKFEQPKWDRWDIRLPDAKDQAKAISRFHKSGCDTKSDFLRSILLDKPFRIVAIDNKMMDHTIKLTEYILAVNKIGVLYNQAVSSINKYHSEQKAKQLLAKLEVLHSALLNNLIEVTKNTRELKNGHQSNITQKP